MTQSEDGVRDTYQQIVEALTGVDKTSTVQATGVRIVISEQPIPKDDK
jgi:hypothetical protein